MRQNEYVRGEPYLTTIPGKPSFYIEWYDKTTKRNRRRSTGAKISTGKSEAKLALEAFKAERKNPSVKNPDELLVIHALDDYWNDHMQHMPSAGAAKWVVKRLEVSSLVHLTLAHVTQSRIDEYVRDGQKRGLSNGTIRKDLGYLQAAFNHVKREQHLTWVPEFRMPPAPKPRERILTTDEVRTILTHCKSDHVRNSIILMFNTGQRPGAVAGLTWFQVDFKGANGCGVIHFERTGKQETNKRVRPVIMNQEVRELLWELYQSRSTEFVIEQVFKNKHGEITKARPAGNIKKALDRACRAAGLNTADTDRNERVNRYTFRHTFANTIMADDKTRSDIMGHTSIRTTQHHYVKTNFEKHQEALETLPKLRTNYAPAGNAPWMKPVNMAEILGGR